MADDTLRTTADPTLDGALERFERAEAELEETEERRKRLSDEAARAAAELESTLDQAIRKAIDERDRLEEELAAVVDHIAKLEAIRTRSGKRNSAVTLTAVPKDTEDGDGSEGTEGATKDAYEDQWYELMKSRGDDAAFSS